MKNVKFFTLGCKVNAYETEAMRTLFEQRGYTVTDGEADVVVINTCTVTQTGDRKSRQIIRRAKRDNPNAVVVVTGCYAQVSPREAGAIEGVDIVLGTTDRSKVVDMVEQFSGSQINAVKSKIPDKFEELFATEQSRVRATLKIQDGCRNFCSYCIIPFARGPVRSRPIDSAVAEVCRLAKDGYSEVVLTGIHLGSYGMDTGDSLIDIIRAICEVEGVRRVRLGSLEPNLLSEEFCSEIAKLGNLMPHFHVSMQSGCTATLKRMNRRYTADEYLQALQRLRRAIPGCSIATDVMTGFPGESREEFEESMETVRRAAFSSIHVFPYSVRKGTKAATMEGQVEESVKHSRAKEMIQLGEELKESYCSHLIGHVREVLFEQEAEPGVYEGLTEEYVRVFVRGDNLEGKYAMTRLTEYCGGHCGGVIVEKE